LSAAYAIALQLLLVGFAYAKINASSTPEASFAICHNAGDQPGERQDNPAQGKGQQSCCVACPLAGFGGLPNGSAAQSVVLRLAADVNFRGSAFGSPRNTKDHDPRSSQGPPQVA
jgi:hypothetical protein